MAFCVNSAGRKEHTNIHFVADGAEWIASQVERVFGSDATFLIDFYHLSTYIAQAAQCCSPSTSKGWIKTMQDFMKKGMITSVLNELKNHINDTSIKSHDCFALTCYKYIEKRLQQFDYKGAKQKGLPIGSGRVVSARRTILQKRLKIQGAWWLKQNANTMLLMRAVRENDFWSDYWEQFKKQTVNMA